MDRPTTRKDADARGSRLGPHEAFVLPSRRSAVDLCRAQLGPAGLNLTSPGPILLTGDAGVGKTWLWRTLEAEAPANHDWVAVDLTPANSPSDFFRLISHELGLSDPACTSTGRVELIDFLAERRADGHRLTLVIDEAHNLAVPVWEEVRVLANRLDRPGGFSSLILVGQTSLARRFSTRPFAAIEARLASKIHLGPIDADEAAELVARFRPSRSWSVDEIETLHRDSGGNPRRILQKLGPVVRSSDVQPESLPPEVEIRKAVPTIGVPPARRPEPAPTAAISAPLIGPSRPPIRMDENMIEVGWSPDDLPAVDDPDESEIHRSVASRPVEATEEAVQDHYAALQAWREWTENQARRLATIEPAGNADRRPASSEIVEIDATDEDEVEDEGEIDDLAESRLGRLGLRAEGEQKFAPFGQLFTRMAQAHEPE